MQYYLSIQVPPLYEMEHIKCLIFHLFSAQRAFSLAYRELLTPESRSLIAEAGRTVASLETLARQRVRSCVALSNIHQPIRGQDPGHVINLHQSKDDSIDCVAAIHKHLSMEKRLAELRLPRRISEAIL